MSRQFLIRLLETFFRRWVLYAVPVVLFLGLGFSSVRTSEDAYVSTGVIYVDDESLLAALTEVRGATGQWWKTAAELTSEQMNSAFQTDALVRTMAEQAGMTEALEGGSTTIDDLRRSVSVVPNGSNLVQVRASRSVPEESPRLARAAIESFMDFVVDVNLRESSSAEEFLTELVSDYEQDVAATRGALDMYLAFRSEPGTGVRPALEQTEIDRLQAAIATAEERHDDARSKLENAQLATAQTRADVSQRLRLVDEPQTPVAPQGTLRDDALTMAMFGSLGLLLSGAAIVAAALLDTSIRTPADVTDRLHSVVLAALPEVPQPPLPGPDRERIPLRPLSGT